MFRGVFLTLPCAVGFSAGLYWNSVWAVWGALAGLVAAPVAVVEIAAARRSLSAATQLGVAALCGLLATAGLEIAYLQAVYAVLGVQEAWEDLTEAIWPLLVGRVCLGVPFALFTFVRLRNWKLWQQILATCIGGGLVTLLAVAGVDAFVGARTVFRNDTFSRMIGPLGGATLTLGLGLPLSAWAAGRLTQRFAQKPAAPSGGEAPTRR